MTITLRPEHEELIAQAIKTGAYQTPDEVIARALEVFHLVEDDRLQEDKDWINEKLERAFGQFERDEFLSPEESRADMEKRKAVWLAEHGRG